MKSVMPTLGETDDATAPQPTRPRLPSVDKRSQEIGRLRAKVLGIAECLGGVRLMLNRSIDRLTLLAFELDKVEEMT